MPGKNKSAKIDDAVSKSVNYEVTIADMAQRSARRAWMVAFAAIVMALILAGGYFYMLPLKEKVPFLVMADAYTGNATVARLDENFKNRSVSTSEAINRSNVAHFVQMRESYDYAMMLLRDWRAVHSMSSPDVATAYNALYASNNPESPYNVYGKRSSVRVAILSIVFIGGGNGGTPQGATVRFQRSLYDKNNGASKPLDSKIATLGFTYNFNLEMGEKDRIENPLGFQVTSYQVNNDFAASPPVPHEVENPLLPPVQDALSPAQDASASPPTPQAGVAADIPAAESDVAQLATPSPEPVDGTSPL